MFVIKKLLKRPLSSADAYKLASQNMQSPPLPKELLEASAKRVVGKNGISLIEYWRQYFSHCLDEMVSAQSWELQRSKLINRILTEQGWRVGYTVAKDAKSVNSWADWVKDVDYFKNSTKEKWPGLLLQRYFLATLTETCLLDLACKFFRIDGIKQMEIMLHYEYEKEIKALDFAVNEIMFNCASSYKDSEAFEIARMKDEIVNPLLSEQYKLLLLMREQIANSTLDAPEAGEKMMAFSERKNTIAANLTAGTYGYQF